MKSEFDVEYVVDSLKRLIELLSQQQFAELFEISYEWLNIQQSLQIVSWSNIFKIF